MELGKRTCEDWVDALSSKEPIPGGGGASALVGAIGAALGGMVGSLTEGKRKYADVEEDIQRLIARARDLQGRLLQLMDEDARAFEPLSRAYGLPKGTEEERRQKDEVMEAALREAAKPPLRIMEAACEAIRMQRELLEKGSRLALSDVGVGAALLRGALLGASLNVLANTKLMKDRERAEEMNREAERMLEECVPLSDEIFEKVRESLT